jgi:endoglucanase
MAYLSGMGPVWRAGRGARRRSGVLLCAAVAVACAVAACSSGSPATTGQASTGHASTGQASPDRPRHHRHDAAPRLHVSGNRLVDSRGRPVALHGVNRSGTEFLCVQGHGIFDGPSGQASVSAMKSWGINAVRIPLNEACWNGESYVDPAYAGANYQSAIRTYVNLLNSNGIVAVLDLHWTDGRYTGPSSACASAQARCLKPMPDAAQAIPFWTSVAQAFKGNDAVLFDLFNEPFPERASHNEAGGWECWLHGGSCPGIGYQVAGMQGLVDAVRATGARNVILVSGLAYANDLTGWLAHEPADPEHGLAASWHSYNFNACSSLTCWTSEVAPVIARVPLVAGEIGENDCASGYITALTGWLDSEPASYLAWAWNADFPCASGPGLITSYAGSPTPYGAGYRAHLRSLAG